jgi:Caspase domain/Domain of unknown function (DUF4189)
MLHPANIEDQHCAGLPPPFWRGHVRSAIDRLSDRLSGRCRSAGTVIVLCLSLLLPLPVQAEARIALLIGNQAYNAKVGPLQNPINDITLIGAALEKLNFKVTLVRDADYRSTNAAIKRHIAAARREGQGAISVFYYSGHGAANPETKVNYLIPVDVANADDKDLWLYSINLNTLVDNLRDQASGTTHYIIFDACRNELNLTTKGQKSLTNKGFVPMKYTPGVLVAYATAPGGTASDVGSGGGAYARALSEEIVKPGLESMLVFTRVARRVQREIGQDPFLSASTMPEVYFASEAVASNGSEAERAWGSIKDSRNPHDFEAFRRQYGAASPLYDEQAGRRIRELERDAAAVADAEAKRAWAVIKDESNPAVLEAFIAKYADTLYGPIARARLEQIKNSRVAVAPPPGPPREPAPVAPATLPSGADQRYGAIAYSPATGSQGWAHDYDSKDAAEAAATTNCRLQANDCSVPVSFRNGCGALAVGSTNFGSGWGADRKTAERFALRLCGQRSRNCRILRQVCTTP